MPFNLKIIKEWFKPAVGKVETRPLIVQPSQKGRRRKLLLRALKGHDQSIQMSNQRQSRRQPHSDVARLESSSTDALHIEVASLESNRGSEASRSRKASKSASGTVAGDLSLSQDITNSRVIQNEHSDNASPTQDDDRQLTTEDSSHSHIAIRDINITSNESSISGLMLDTPSTPEIPVDISVDLEGSRSSCDAETKRLSLSYDTFIDSSATTNSLVCEHNLMEVSHLREFDDRSASQDQSQAEEMSASKSEYFNKLRSLEHELHQAKDTTLLLRRELKLKSDAVDEQSDLKNAHNELQERHKAVTTALESELRTGRTQSEAISELREQIDVLRRQQNQDSEIHQKAMEFKTEELKNLATAAEKDRISWEFYYHKCNHLSSTLEDDPKMRSFDQDNLLENREKQLFEAKKDLINVSSAYESLETSHIEQLSAASKKIQTLEQKLASANEKGEMDLRRANDLQTRLKDMSNNLIKRSGEMLVPVPEDVQMHHQVAVRDNSLLTSKISVLETRLQSAQISKIASEEQCADLRNQLAQKADLELQIRTKECENGKLRFEADALVKDHKQELMQKDGQIDSLHKGISTLRNSVLAQTNLGLSEKAQRIVELKDDIIQKLQARLETAHGQLEVAKAREDKRDDIATWDRIVHNIEDRAYRNLQDRLATAEAELVDLRNAHEGYDTWIWQENRVLKSQIKKTERECNEDLDKAVAAVEKIREARDKYSAENEHIWNLGERLLQRVKALEGRLVGKGDKKWVDKFHRESDLMQLAVGEFEIHSDDTSSDADADADAGERQDNSPVKHEHR